jgi:hypothetical protein
VLVKLCGNGLAESMSQYMLQAYVSKYVEFARRITSMQALLIFRSEARLLRV